MPSSRHLAFLLATAATAVGGLLVQHAPGAAVVTTDAQSGPSPFTPSYTPSSSDLLNGMTPSSQSGNFQQEAAGGVAVLTDGTFGTIDRSGPGYSAPFATAGNNGGTSLTYTLGSPTNLASIDVYGGWQDNGRDQQGYSVLYSTAADPATFLPLATVDFNPSLTTGGVPSATKVTINDPSGTLAANVSAIRFNFATVENGYTGYAEIDAFGTPVPEPTSLGLLASGALGLLARRRRSA